MTSFGKGQHNTTGVKLRVTSVRYDRGSGPSSARTKTTMGCSRPFRSSRLNRDFSRRADLANRRNEVKPRAAIHGVNNFHHSPVAWRSLRLGALGERLLVSATHDNLVGLRSKTSLENRLKLAYSFQNLILVEQHRALSIRLQIHWGSRL